MLFHFLIIILACRSWSTSFPYGWRQPCAQRKCTFIGAHSEWKPWSIYICFLFKKMERKCGAWEKKLQKNINALSPPPSLAHDSLSFYSNCFSNSCMSKRHVLRLSRTNFCVCVTYPCKQLQSTMRTLTAHLPNTTALHMTPMLLLRHSAMSVSLDTRRMDLWLQGEMLTRPCHPTLPLHPPRPNNHPRPHVVRVLSLLCVTLLLLTM